MNTTVAQLFPKNHLSAGREMGTPIASFTVPIGLDDKSALNQALTAEGYISGSRALWLTYPSLKEASEKLISNLSLRWPSKVGHYPAAIQAILKAFKFVDDGLQVGEGTREHIVANYLRGLGMAAEDIVQCQAWGFQGNRVIEQWISMDQTFAEWANSGHFDEVRIYLKEAGQSRELEGTRLKLICAVAGVKDVGVLSRFR